MGLIFPLLLVGAVYFLMLRPQQQRVARQRQLVSSIEPGDEVVTAGGIIGVVRRLDDERLWLEVAPGMEITLLRGAVAQKVVAPDLDDEPDLGDDRDEGFNGL
jgi:preprotein translocase subunit YajC